MPNPFIHKNAFTPELVTKVAEAYDRNQKNRAGAFADDISARSLADVIKANIAGAKNRDSATRAGFDQLSNLHTREIFESSFAMSDQLFSRIGLTIPTPEQCIDAGINLGIVGTVYERMSKSGLKPEIVLSPVLSIDSWLKLYGNLEYYNTASMIGLLRNEVLFIAPSAARSWDELTILPSCVPAIDSCDADITWSLRLIPGTSEPTVPEVDHLYNHGTHPTVSEYLSLQANRLQVGQDPIDCRSNTWLNGQYTDRFGTRYAPMGFWNSVERSVGIRGLAPDPQFSTPGARPPEWD